MSKFRTIPIEVDATFNKDSGRWTVTYLDGESDEYGEEEFRESFEPNNFDIPSVKKFWEKVDKSGGEDACWMWTSALDKNGYGKVTIDFGDYRAHRVSYEICVDKIPTGMVICHKCDTPGCVNPKHLFVGTNAENTADRDRKGHGVWSSERNPKAKLTEVQVLEIRNKYSAGNSTYSSLSREYGVQPIQIQNIIKGDDWKWLL